MWGQFTIRVRLLVQCLKLATLIVMNFKERDELPFTEALFDEGFYCRNFMLFKSALSYVLVWICAESNKRSAPLGNFVIVISSSCNADLLFYQSSPLHDLMQTNRLKIFGDKLTLSRLRKGGRESAFEQLRRMESGNTELLRITRF